MDKDVLMAILNVIIGFGLAVLWDWIKEGRAKREEARNIRDIIREEVRYNKTVLKEVIERIRDQERLYKATIKPDNMGGFTVKGDPWKEMLNFVPDRLTHDAWQSQLPKISSALPREGIARAMVFYRNLAEIQFLQSVHRAGYSGAGRVPNETMQNMLKLMQETIEIPLLDND